MPASFCHSQKGLRSVPLYDLSLQAWYTSHLKFCPSKDIEVERHWPKGYKDDAPTHCREGSRGGFDEGSFFEGFVFWWVAVGRHITGIYWSYLIYALFGNHVFFFPVVWHGFWNMRYNCWNMSSLSTPGGKLGGPRSFRATVEIGIGTHCGRLKWPGYETLPFGENQRTQDALVLRDTYWHEWNRVLFMSGTWELVLWNGWGGTAMVQG